MLKISRLVLLSGLVVAVPQFAEARPVSYPGGTSVMLMNDGDQNSAHVDYTLTPKFSVGAFGEYWREEDFGMGGVQFNFLAKRWNNPDSQANFYLKGGIGVAYSDQGDFDHETEPAGFAGLAVDWENRRFLTAYENRFTQAGDIDDFYMQSARVGVAPYVGEFGDLHTWLMVQVDHKPEAEDPVTVTPLVRFFKGVHLVEAGMNNHGEVLFNWTIQY